MNQSIEIVKKYKEILIDEKACEAYLQKVEKYKDFSKGKVVLIGVGSAGAHFLYRVIEDKFHPENPIMLLSNEEELINGNTPYSYLFKENPALLEDNLQRYYDHHGSTSVFVIGALGGRGREKLIKTASIAKKIGFRTIIVGYCPFGFEDKKKVLNADNMIQRLYDLPAYDDLLIIRNGDILSFVDRKAMMPTVYSLIDEPIRGYIDYLSLNSYYDYPKDFSQVCESPENGLYEQLSINNLRVYDEELTTIVDSDLSKNSVQEYGPLEIKSPFEGYDPKTKKTKNYRILFTFDNKATEKSYMAFTDETKGARGSMNTYAAVYDPRNLGMSLKPIESQSEINIVEKVLEELQKEIDLSVYES